MDRRRIPDGPRMDPQPKSLYRNFAQGGIIKEQKCGLVLGRLAVLKKKIGSDYEHNILVSALKSCIK